jgi:plastocyanin
MIMRAPRLTKYLVVATTLACGGGSSVTTPTDGGGSNPPPSSATAAVTIRDFSYTPASLTIKSGTTVRWTNSGPSAHTTVSDAGVWQSDMLSSPTSGGGYGGGATAGGTFDFTFSQPGTYSYHCSIHPPSSYPNFTGTIIVTP